MKCSQAILLMEKARAGKIPPSNQRRLAKHLQDCPGCSEYQQRRQEMAAVLMELRRPPRQE